MTARGRVRSTIERTRGSPLPAAAVRPYLEGQFELAGLLAANGIAFLVGLQYYAASFDQVHFLTWWLFADSPVALALGTVALATMIPSAGSRAKRQTGQLSAVIHTLAIVALVFTGVWTTIVVGWGWATTTTYAPSEALFLILTHLGFVVEAAVLAHVGTTDRIALGTAGLFVGVTLYYDYVLGHHPPIPYPDGSGVAMIGALLVAPLALGAAWWWLPRRTQAV